MSQGYDRLRKFLNESIKGIDTDSVLYALSYGDDLLDNNSQAAVQNMFLATAKAEFLDYLASNVGVVRPGNIGISDDSLRDVAAVFIGYKNTENAINDLLKIYFDVYRTNAFVETSNYEDFALADEDNLLLKIDGVDAEVVFYSSYFDNIATTPAVEVANYFNNYFLDMKLNAIATVFFDTLVSSYTVRLISKTQGAAGSIEILGGTAQKALNFPQRLETTQDATTQFSISSPSNGLMRLTWTGGQDPDLDLLDQYDYVIISGVGFNSYNKGTFSVTNVVSGPEDYSYFEVENVDCVNQTLTLTVDSDILFFNTVKSTVSSQDQYAAIYETTPGEIDLIIPASTSIVERTPTTGGSYLTEVSYSFVTSVTTGFELGETVIDTSSKASGIVTSIDGLTVVLGDVQQTLGNFLGSGTLYGETSLLSTAFSATPTQTWENELSGAYLYDLSAYVLTKENSSLSSVVYAGTNNIIIEVLSTESFPDSGYLTFDFGHDNQEDAVPYIKILNSREIQINPSYIFQESHMSGSDVTVLLSKDTYEVSSNGDDLGAYLTDVANARQDFVNNLYKIKSAGIFINERILYPDDYGLGNAGSIYSDIVRIYGPDSSMNTDGFLDLVE